MKQISKITLAVLTTVATSMAAAADYPSKTVNYVIPFGPGGESDISARLQEPVFKKLTGQSLAIQYKPGAGGAAGWSKLNDMTADGYTVMGTNLPHIVLQPMAKDVGYQTDDVTTVFWFHYTPDALLVPSGSPVKILRTSLLRRSRHLVRRRSMAPAPTLQTTWRNSSSISWLVSRQPTFHSRELAHPMPHCWVIRSVAAGATAPFKLS